MNFFSHLAIASTFTEDANVALGAMLPDFASMLGVRPPRAMDGRVQRGYELHHATDRLFHELESFRTACRTESAYLRDCGVERGSAMAVAHVGLEFFLDEALSEDEISSRLYARVLNEATPSTLGKMVDWKTPDHAASFESLRQRLTTLARTMNGPTSSLSHAERICRTLSRRPRLAVRADDRTTLERWAVEAAPRYAWSWPGVVNTVTAGLEQACWSNQRSGGRSLRFRRAQPCQV